MCIILLYIIYYFIGGLTLYKINIMLHHNISYLRIGTYRICLNNPPTMTINRKVLFSF